MTKTLEKHTFVLQDVKGSCAELALYGDHLPLVDELLRAQKEDTPIAVNIAYVSGMVRVIRSTHQLADGSTYELHATQARGRLVDHVA